MSDGRNGGGRKAKALREIPFQQIERDFDVTSMTLGSMKHPAVGREEDGYFIRVLTRAVRRGIDVKRYYAYFRTESDGTVTEAPRGHAKDYKPARITGLDEAIEWYAVGGAS